MPSLRYIYIPTCSLYRRENSLPCHSPLHVCMSSIISIIHVAANVFVVVVLYLWWWCDDDVMPLFFLYVLVYLVCLVQSLGRKWCHLLQLKYSGSMPAIIFINCTQTSCVPTYGRMPLSSVEKLSMVFTILAASYHQQLFYSLFLKGSDDDWPTIYSWWCVEGADLCGMHLII